ncbi:hypothetical protein [Martelella radicis]|uniref:Uncharacterized protein n=1 Tax=Martelella radicis TaxID=1397476 RepID=A0A7W6PA47_9HYPH|nr:hypothetical protein [Martelella radicis]MBB4121047.1 hypothetical protein [Martelella radicis]
MDKSMRVDELRIVIRPEDESANSARPIPARIFQKTFNAIFNTLDVTNRELHSKKQRSEFFISHLAMGSNEVGVVEQRRTLADSSAPTIAEVKGVMSSVYHSDWVRAVERKRLAKAIMAVGKAINPKYPAIAYFGSESDTIPLDAFFAKQAERLRPVIEDGGLQTPFFAGSAIGSFDGRLGSIDYRGAAWKGFLVLPGGGVQIECVFDHTKGENAFNPFGNKRVSVTGTAIYTGDSQLPERIEVTHIEEIPIIEKSVDLRGSLSGKKYMSGWDIGYKNLQ